MEQIKRKDLLAGREKAYTETCQNLAGCFLAKYLDFSIITAQKHVKNSQNHAIFWPGQAQRSTIYSRA